jgi:hypothetical protein
MNDPTKLDSWRQTVRPDGTLVLKRRFRDLSGIRKFGMVSATLFFVALVGQFFWNGYVLTTISSTIPSIPRWLPWLVLVTLFLLTLLRFFGGLLGQALVGGLWGDEELLVRENYLEHRVIFGRWRRATRITEGWVYLEPFDGAYNTTGYQVRVRGKGGDVVLDKSAYSSSSSLFAFEETPYVPTSIAQLAEVVAQKTEWHLDVPSLLRRGSQIRTY